MRNTYRFCELDGEPVVYIKASNADVEFIVDVDDFEKAKEYNWRYRPNGYSSGRRYMHPSIPLHWLVKGRVDGLDIDHINQNRLDNRKSNLRIVPRCINAINVGLRSNNTSGFRGVGKSGLRWQARVGVSGKIRVLGTFDTPEEASAVVERFWTEFEQAEEARFLQETGRRFSDPGEPVAV